jgi:Lon protease-like protein
VPRLPLFPLGTVLFPGLLLPLHVFEDRYRALVRDLVDGPAESRAFGVIAIREGREVGADGIRALHPIGCVAELRQVEPHSDGRFDIVTSGVRRFRIESLDLTSQPYLQADVAFLDEPAGDAATVLARSVSAVWSAYRERLTGGPADDADLDELSDDPGMLSYLVAAATVLDLADKQRLLEEPDTTSRLRRELAILRREAALLRLLPSLPAVDLPNVAVSPN